MADAATDVALASATRTEDQNRGAAVEPGVATGQGHDVGLGEHRHLGELEAGERLGRIELRLDAVPFDAPLGSLGDLVLEGGRPGSAQPASLPCRSARRTRARACRSSACAARPASGRCDQDRWRTPRSRRHLELVELLARQQRIIAVRISAIVEAGFRVIVDDHGSTRVKGSIVV